MLTEQKAEVGHGNWMEWVAENLTVSLRTAEHHLDFYEYRDLIKIETVSTFRDVIQKIRALKKGDEESKKRKGKEVTIKFPATKAQRDQFLDLMEKRMAKTEATVVLTIIEMAKIFNEYGDEIEELINGSKNTTHETLAEAVGRQLRGRTPGSH